MPTNDDAGQNAETSQMMPTLSTSWWEIFGALLILVYIAARSLKCRVVGRV